MYALRGSDGRVQWTYHASGDVTAGPAYSNGLLYFGDYGGNVQAVRASNGKLVWRTHEAGLGFGRSGGFYGTPAVSFGRVYVGNLDRKVYSFSARTGQLAWSHTTGNYVYAAPAVADVPGVDPSVYVGSYDGTFYALDARTGAQRWSYRATGPISGAASVIGRIVYFSTLQTHRTYGLDVRTGKLVFSFAHGAYNPAISDGQKLYITGYSTPVRPAAAQQRQMEASSSWATWRRCAWATRPGAAAMSTGCSADLTDDIGECKLAGIFPGLDSEYRGRDDFLRFMDGIVGPWEEFAIVPVRLIEAGENRVVGLTRFRGRGREGIEVEREFGHLIDFRDGLAAQIQSYDSWDEALAAAGVTE